jgi:type IV pilus assembly protein PilF
MKANRLFGLILLLLLSACAQTPDRQAQQGKDTAALESVNQRAKVHTELAAQYFARQQYSVALQEIREAMQADSAYAPAYMMLGLVHESLLEYKEAEESFRHAIRLAPEYSEAHNNYGLFLCRKKHYAEAMQEFEEAWKNPLYSTPEKALANAGQCALRKGDVELAANYTRRALARAPDQIQALLTLAEIQYSQGDATMAHMTIGKVSNPGLLDAYGLWLGVKIERKLGNREAEAEYGKQLRNRFPETQETGWLLSGQYDR